MKHTLALAVSLLVLHLAACSEMTTLPLEEEEDDATTKVKKAASFYNPPYCNGPCSKPLTPICTTDGTDFASECLMDRSNCLNRKQQTVGHKGNCAKCLVDEEAFGETTTILTLPERCVDLKCVGQEIFNGRQTQFVGTIQEVPQRKCHQVLPVHLRKEIDELQDLCEGQANIEDPDIALSLTFTVGKNGDLAPRSNML